MNNLLKGKNGPLLIAEIGGNHEGDFEYAKKLTALAIDSGVDLVKFQIYTGDTLVSDIESPDRNLHFKKFELSPEQHKYLANMVRDAGLFYSASVWDTGALEWIDPFISIYKIGSGDLTAYPVIREIALKNKPIILSTGLSTEKEVLECIQFIQSVNQEYFNKEMLAVLQCTSMYPIRPEDAHLQVITRMKEITGLTVGYSDHTEGSKALLYAAAMGAEILEFHFTDDRQGKTFRDHKVSLTRDEVGKLIDDIRELKTFQGCAIKKPLEIEEKNGHVISFRRAVYPKRDILKGELLDEDNLTVLRPNLGIDAKYYYQLIGKRAAVDLKKHHQMNWEMLEND
jgi:N-acetylneuraminate synthase/N,N'-diacetyllegionaminate synthase